MAAVREHLAERRDSFASVFGAGRGAEHAPLLARNPDLRRAELERLLDLLKAGQLAGPLAALQDAALRAGADQRRLPPVELSLLLDALMRTLCYEADARWLPHLNLVCTALGVGRLRGGERVLFPTRARYSVRSALSGAFLQAQALDGRGAGAEPLGELAEEPEPAGALALSSLARARAGTDAQYALTLAATLAHRCCDHPQLVLAVLARALGEPRYPELLRCTVGGEPQVSSQLGKLSFSQWRMVWARALHGTDPQAPRPKARKDRLLQALVDQLNPF